MFIVDVGASGGIDAYWHEFGRQFEAVGFDPLVAEIERLNAAAPQAVRYVAAWVTSHDPGTDARAVARFYSRTSALRAAQIAGLDYARDHFNAGVPIELSEDSVVLDDHFGAADRARVDFLKVDTDGSDYDVLRGADSILRCGGVLGLAVEVQFQGLVGTETNLFSNIDLYLRERGFSLFDLEVHRYSRSALPSPFVYEIPADTVTGQVFWGEAVYFRDLGDPEYEAMWGFKPTRIDICKLICLLEIFGLADCSAELVLKYREALGDAAARSAYLDVLAAQQTDDEMSYVQLQRAFADDTRRRFSPRGDRWTFPDA
jgi:FkbM family methyltransferase